METEYKIYFDGVHLATDNPNLGELHAKAKSIGLSRRWFQDHPRHPHYDVFGAPAKKLEVNCSSVELVKSCTRKG